MCSLCADISSYLKYTCTNGSVDWTSDLVGGYLANATYTTATMCGCFFEAGGQPPVLMSGYKLDSSTSEPADALLARPTPMLSVYDKTPLMGHGSILFPTSAILSPTYLLSLQQMALLSLYVEASLLYPRNV